MKIFDRISRFIENRPVYLYGPAGAGASVSAETVMTPHIVVWDEFDASNPDAIMAINKALAKSIAKS